MIIFYFFLVRMDTQDVLVLAFEMKTEIFLNLNVQRICVICNNVLISSLWNFWDIVIPYHKSGLSFILDRNTIFDKSDFYKVISIYLKFYKYWGNRNM